MTSADKALYNISIDHLVQFIRTYIDKSEHPKVVEYITNSIIKGVFVKETTIETVVNGTVDANLIPTFGKATRNVQYRYNHTGTTALVTYRDKDTQQKVDEAEVTHLQNPTEIQTYVDHFFPKEITYLHGNTLQNTFRVPSLRNLH